MTYNAHPVALLDQIEAAESELTRMLDTAAAEFGSAYDETRPGPWLVEQIDRFTNRIMTGDATECRHMSHSGGPIPSFAALSAPGLLVCARCVRLLITGDPDTNTCDRCHQTGPDMQMLTLELGTIALFVIECRTCADQDTPARA